MKLHQLPKTTTKKAKRVGRGPGSGKGKTSGRGMKGQKARSKVRAGQEGGQLPFLRRLPFLRGVGFGSHKPQPQILAIERLNVFPADTTVTPEALVEQGLVRRVPKGGVKILNNGNLEKRLVLKGILVSAGAREQIEGQGGKVTD